MDLSFNEKAFQLAREIGFDHLAPVDPKKLTPLQEVRAMCDPARCKQVGHSWSCPPYCGSTEILGKRMHTYACGILVQTTGVLPEALDLETIKVTEKKHKQHFDALVRQMKTLYPDLMPMSSGACTRCKACTCPDRPCRFPDRLYPSMEACGLFVSKVCTEAGLGYNYGENTVTFTACVLYCRKESSL